jgi:hypothetical protein
METAITISVNGSQTIGILHLPDRVAGNAPAVLLLHGLTGNKTEAHRIFVKTARALQRKGFTVLRFDFRGWGDSEWESEQSTIVTMIEDARAATDFLLGQRGVDATRLGYLGFSTGGAVAAQAIERDPRVRSLVLWNPVGDGAVIFRGRITNESALTLKSSNKAEYNGNWLGRELIEQFMTMKPAACLARRPVPTLILQAANDVAVPPSQADIYLEAVRGSGTRCEKVIVPEADHVFIAARWEQDVIERTVGWFADTLRP